MGTQCAISGTLGASKPRNAGKSTTCQGPSGGTGIAKSGDPPPQGYDLAEPSLFIPSEATYQDPRESDPTIRPRALSQI